MKQQRGMTLIEVLVALAIFATASLSIMKAVTQHTNTLSYLQEKTFAAMVLDNQMALLHLSGLPKSEKRGKVEMVGRTWYWKAVPIKTDTGFLRAVDVSVSDKKALDNPIVTVRSYGPN